MPQVFVYERGRIRVKKISLLIIFALFVLCTATFANDSEGKWQSRDLVQFVEGAAVLVEKEGEASFPEFRKTNGPWFQGDIYVFIWGLDGKRYVYPPDPSGEGKNMMALVDINGKPIGKQIIEVARSKAGKGWVHYQWPRPFDIYPLWKTTYIKRAVAPSGKEYLAGAGIYNMKMEKDFIVFTVDAAVELIEQKGRTAFHQLRDKRSQFFYKDTYVFVVGLDGVELVNPGFPSLEGRNLLNYRDASGKLLVREMIEKTKTAKSAWVDYYWPHPEHGKSTKKSAYIRRTTMQEGMEVIVGAGLYAE